MRDKKRLKNRIVSLALCAMMAFSSVQVPAMTVAAAETEIAPLVLDVSDEELKAVFPIKDVKFGSGLDNWEAFVMLPEWEWSYNTKANFTAVENGVEVHIDSVGETGDWAGLWTVALTQKSQFPYGRQYRVAFDVTSTIDRTIASGIQERVMENGSEVDGTWNSFETTTLTAGETQHVEYVINIDTRDVSGNFTIQMGAEEKGKALDPHDITISNLVVEEDGSRGDYIKLEESEFTGDNFTLNNGQVTDRYVTLQNGGSIMFEDIEVEAGVNYDLSFAVRAAEGSNVTATIDGVELADFAVTKYTEEHSINYTPSETGTVTLAISADGVTYLDNVGLWVTGVADTLVNVLPTPSIMLSKLVLTAEKERVALGQDITVGVAVEDGSAFDKNANHTVRVNGKELAASDYTLTENALTISGSTFKDTGRATIELIADGYEISSKEFVYIMPADGNLILNGSFENGLSGWTTYFNERYSATAEITSDYRAAISIEFFLNWYDASGNDNGPVTWSTMLQQPNIAVENGKTYKLSFTASSTVERPIAVELLGKTEYIVLQPEDNTYSIEFTSNQAEPAELKFLMGQFAESVYKAFPFTTENFEKHTIHITDVSLVDADIADDYKKQPSIIGIEEGGDYKAPVYINVNYKVNPYTIEVTKNGQKIDYVEGDEIREDGNYVVTVKDSTDASVSVSKSFTLNMDLDYSKEYVVIRNKSTEKVLEAQSLREGSNLIQSQYAERATQFFAIEESRKPGYVIIRCLANDYVVDVENASLDDGAQLILSEYTESNSQLWKIDDTVHQGFVKFVNKASGKVFDVNGAAKTEGLPVTQATQTSNDDEGQQSVDGQRWDIITTIDVQKAIEGEVIDVSTADAWSENAIVTPVEDGLNPAGPITVEFYPLAGAESYDIYIDGEKSYSITQEELENATVQNDYMVTEDGTIKLFEAGYSTEVAEHTIYIQTNTGTKTRTIDFFLSKKGVGWSTLHRVEDMNLSWYYHWATGEAIGTDEDLEFVPMLWGNYGDEWLRDSANKEYGTVLSFNEPDWSDQSNVPVTIKLAEEWTARYNQKYGTNRERPSTVEEAWQAFMDSGLRIGSPATALAPPVCNGIITMNDVDGPDNWWFDFMDLMEANSDKGWDYDFVAIHSYNQECSAEGLLSLVDQTYELTGKPIWITEFGVARWDNKDWNGNNAQTQQKVIDFMVEVLNGLEERPYVERYAWFPFDPNDAYGGASGIFDYETGELNALGQVYAQLGVPEGYDAATYPTEVPTLVNIKTDKTELILGESTTVSLSGNKTAEWSSDNEDVITVDAAGNVEAVGIGEATVTATTADGTDSVKFTVVAPKFNKVTIKAEDDTNISQMLVGTEATLTIETDPVSETDLLDVTWESSNPDVVGINGNKITALSKGTAQITVTVEGTTGIIVVNVYEEIPSVSATITKSRDTIVVGETVQCTATVTPAETSYTWQSQSPSVATVDENGLVTAVSEGTAMIDVCVDGKVIATTAITVKEKVQLSISVSKNQLLVGESVNVEVISVPDDASLSFVSSDPDVASVDENGTIKALKVGTATITVTSGETSKTVDITVVESINEEKDALEKAKTDLRVALAVAETYDETLYTEDSWKTFADALTAAKEVFASETATTDELKQATDALTAAQNNLKKIDTTAAQELKEAKTTLNAVITAANTFAEKNYTAESWKVFASALTAAKNVFANENATTVEVKQATDALTNAQTLLVKVDNSGKDGQAGQNAQITMSIAKTTILETEQTQCTVIGEQKPVYESSNPAVATVDANGVVTGVTAGTATITATSTTLGSKSSVTINVIKPTVKWNVTYKTVPLQLKKGKKVNKTTVLQPTGLQEGDSIKEYKSSKTKIATVKMNKKGKLTITPKKVGKTKITVTTKHGATATFTLKVQKKAVKVTKITVDNVKNKKLTLQKGKTFTLTTTKKYITALDKVTFTSNKKSVATVSSKGKITAKKKGKATITVKCQKKKTKIKVTVVK